jgi:hypothetical protein
MYHVKEIVTAPPGGLDLNIADEEEFSPDKLRANIERLYMTMVSFSRFFIVTTAHELPGNQHDGIWQAYRSITIMARDTPYGLVLLSVLSGVGV